MYRTHKTLFNIPYSQMFHWKDNDNQQSVCPYFSLQSWTSCEQLIEYNWKLIIIQEKRFTEINKWTQQHNYFFPLDSNVKSWRFSKRSSEFKKTLLEEFAIRIAISLAASIFLKDINAGLLAIAWPINWALLASPCM